jgi:EpsI family protein
MMLGVPGPAYRLPLALAGLMLAASVAAMLARPSAKAHDEAPRTSLEDLVPRRFGEWREVPAGVVQVINPETQALLERLYAETLARVYVNTAGYRIMLSLAYGSDQRGELQAHRPEVCYPAQGFTVHDNVPAVLATRFGEIRGRRLLTSLGARREPVTYWFTLGEHAVDGPLEKRLVELRLAVTGRIPDGLLFRVSSVDGDAAQAWRLQREFVESLLVHVPAARTRLAGMPAH